MRKFNWAILLLFILSINQLKAQMVVNNQITVNDLVNDVLVGDNVDVFNIEINGVPGDQAYTNVGSFDASNSNIPIQQGIVLASGNVNNVIGPNNSGSSSMDHDAPVYYDADLDSVATSSINDVSVLEFDFVPQGEVVLFRYVFSSEEYDEYVCATVNDAFGFFISGPGINGPYSNNGENIALIPNTDIPISINTVNLGFPGSNGNMSNCTEEGLANSEYYTSNATNSDPTSTQMDGFTVIMEATATVVCGEMYHLKMAICNVGDGAFDSAVFLESGSFGAIPIVQIDIETPTDSSLVGEGCQIDFIFDRLLYAEADTVQLFVEGTAENGVDFETLPEYIIFDAGQAIYTLPIVGIYDEIEEGTEDLTLKMLFYSCGDTLEFSATAFITDSHPLGIDMGGPANICNDFGEFATMTADVTGGYGEVQYYWTSGSLTGQPLDGNDPLNPHPTDQPPFYSTNWLTVVDECGLELQSEEPYYTENNCPLMAANIFTPNGDGHNEVFHIENLELYNNSKLSVYNRWGILVYEVDNYLNDWQADGVEDGTYFWVLTMTEPPYEGSQLNGYVVISRIRER
jgi:gliding motility-associated-like protein